MSLRRRHQRDYLHPDDPSNNAGCPCLALLLLAVVLLGPAAALALLAACGTTLQGIVNFRPTQSRLYPGQDKAYILDTVMPDDPWLLQYRAEHLT